MKLSFVAVDEAHCIVEWGNNFRLSYNHIAQARVFLPEGTPIMALTASATPDVIQAISRNLALRSPKQYKASFARENLTYIVRLVSNKKKKIVEALQSLQGGSAIVYTPTRKIAEEIAQLA